MTNLESLRSSCVSLNGEGVRGELVQGAVVECARGIQPMVREVMEVEQLKSYLQWIQEVKRLRSESF